jgi:hypothetical protein
MQETVFVFIIIRRSTGDQIKYDQTGRGCDRTGEKRNSYRILVGKPEGTKSLARTRHICEDNTKYIQNVQQDATLVS